MLFALSGYDFRAAAKFQFSHYNPARVGLICLTPTHFSN